MATNFKISKQRNNENLHLQLEGDFDGTSAFELLKAINGQAGNVHRVFIHTDRIRNLHPFGCNTFRTKAACSGADLGRLVFTGRFACELAVGGTVVKPYLA